MSSSYLNTENSDTMKLYETTSISTAMDVLEILRSFKIFDYAMFDLTLSLLGMWLLAPWLCKLFLKLGIKIPKISWVFWALPIGIIAHAIVQTMTPMTAQFLDPSGYYVLKIFIAALTIAGFRGVKKVKESK